MVLRWFLTELKRRKVYRTAMVYSGIGWMLLEVADVVFPRLGLPDWTVNFVLALVLLGFPATLIFAWIFDLSPQGVVRTHPVSMEAHPRFSIATIIEFFLIGVLVITVGYLYVDRISLQKRLVEPESTNSENSVAGQAAIAQPEQYRSIAVLPFADMSERGDQVWFAEGIAEELLNALAQVRDLRVMARTSSFAFKNTDKTIAEIADVLGVQAVLEGSVRQSGDRIRISAQLVDANSGFHIWTGSYERQLADIFQLQDQLARAIVQALRVELSVATTEPLVAEQTANLEAYNWFVRGRAIFNWDNYHATEQSIGYFEKAVEADPEYAMAWGYLAFARMMSMLWQSFDEIGPATISAYESALALDPQQSEALATKAVITQLVERDWETAGDLYQQAMAAGDNSNALVIYSLIYLMHLDRYAEAIELNTGAERRDPLHAGYKSNLTHILQMSGDAGAAVRKARETLKLNPGHVVTITYLIQLYTDAHDLDAIESLLDSIPPEAAEQPEIKALTGRYYVARGEDERARQIYRELQQLLDGMTPIGLLFTAYLASSIGEVEESIVLLERVVEGGSLVQFHIKMQFMNVEAIRNHPRYQALLKRMGLDTESVEEFNNRIVGSP
tara:strand:- start:13031 stop:14884 length:1854 start_codon:yes stop_codon:yes gene_type:complete